MKLKVWPPKRRFIVTYRARVDDEHQLWIVVLLDDQHDRRMGTELWLLPMNDLRPGETYFVLSDPEALVGAIVLAVHAPGTGH
jgi:hypothetical protein